MSVVYSRPDMTFAVDWALINNYLYIYMWSISILFMSLVYINLIHVVGLYQVHVVHGTVNRAKHVEDLHGGLINPCTVRFFGTSQPASINRSLHSLPQPVGVVNSIPASDRRG